MGGTIYENFPGPNFYKPWTELSDLERVNLERSLNSRLEYNRTHFKTCVQERFGTTIHFFYKHFKYIKLALAISDFCAIMRGVLVGDLDIDKVVKKNPLPEAYWAIYLVIFLFAVVPLLKYLFGYYTKQRKSSIIAFITLFC